MSFVLLTWTTAPKCLTKLSRSDFNLFFVEFMLVKSLLCVCPAAHCVEVYCVLPCLCCFSQAFAKQCTRLRSLRLAGCKQVSDVAILQLSNSCASLDTLDISRSELAYKITDVSMLALGERCHSLTSLNLNGCQFLTDAGMDWLAGGCTALTSLNLSGLFKLTDTCACARL
jgi:hypothetical protein